MADIRRDVGGVTPNTFVQQGVEDNSVAAAIEGLGGIALEADKQFAKSKLRKGIEDTTAAYSVSSPAARHLQDKAAGEPTPGGRVQLTEAEMKDLDDFARIRAKTLNSVDQGKMNHSTYKLIVDRQLRMAIARRPGLARDFREIAEFEMGSEAVNILAAGEAALDKEAAAKAAKEDESKKRLVQMIEKVAEKSGFSAQLAAATDGSLDSIIAWARNPKVAQWFQMFGDLDSRLSLAKAGDELRTLNANDPLTIQKSASSETTLALEGTQEVLRIINDTPREWIEQASAEELNARILLVQQRLTSAITAVREAGSVNRTPKEITDATVAGLQQTLDWFTKTSGGTAEEAREILLKRAAWPTQLLLSKDDTLQLLSAARAMVGPDILEVILPGGSPLNSLANTSILTMAVNKPLSMEAITSIAGVLPRNIISEFADPAKPRSNEDKAQVAPILTKMADQFALADASTYNPDALTGPDGFATVVAQVPSGFRDIFWNEDQKNDFLHSFRMAAMQHTRVLMGAFKANSPHLADKVDVSVSATDGKLFHVKPATSISPSDQAVIANYNQKFGGSTLLRAFSAFEGVDRAKLARELTARTSSDGSDPLAAHQEAKNIKKAPIVYNPTTGAYARNNGSGSFTLMTEAEVAAARAAGEIN